MKRNLKIKEEIWSDFDSSKNFQKIMNRTKEEKNSSTRNDWKMVLVTSFVFLILIGGFFCIKGPIAKMKKENHIVENGNFQIFALSNSEEKEVKKELKENIQVPLKNYNEAMSSIPGFPILFKLEENDSQMEIIVKNGNIYTWEPSSGIVTLLGEKAIINESQTLYFQVQKDTIIDIIYKQGKKKIQKRIAIYQDENFNYYAILTN